MQWSDLPTNPSNRALRQFAAGWLLFFLALAAGQGLHHAHLKLGTTLAAIAVVGGVVGLLRPSAIRPLFRGCRMLAFPIGWLISQALLLIVFYGLFTPLALLFRWRGRDALRLRRPAHPEASLWQQKEAPLDRRRYLRQY